MQHVCPHDSTWGLQISLHVRGRIDASLKDFNIEQPSFAGVRTGMIAEIRVQFALRVANSGVVCHG